MDNTDVAASEEKPDQDPDWFIKYKPAILKLIDEQKIMEEKEIDLTPLKYALDNQIGWQKYAEAKTLLLCTVAGSTAITIAKNIIEDNISRFDLYVFFFAATAAFGVSGIALIAPFKKPPRGKESFHHISYWGYVKDKPIETLVSDIRKYDKEHQLRDLALSHQIGSKLTYRKYTLFNVGMTIYLIGFVFFFGSLMRDHITKTSGKSLVRQNDTTVNQQAGSPNSTRTDSPLAPVHRDTSR